RDAVAARVGTRVAQAAGADQVGRARRVPVGLDVPLVGVVPARLAHRDGTVGGDPAHRAADLRPRAQAALVDELDVALVAPRRHRRAGRGVAGRRPGQRDRGRAPGAGGAHAVDVELAGVEAGGYRGGPQVLRRVDAGPAGHRYPAG